MATWSIILIVVIAVALIVVAGTALGTAARRRRLRARFGPEYDRAVAENQSRRLAEAELSGRERRVQRLSLRELSNEDWERYSAEWASVQERFVDAPSEAVAEAQSLVESVMRDRGYPVTDYDQTVADLSVDHAYVLDRFRLAHGISQRAASGEASTEELRTAMLHYRELFEQLLAHETATDRETVTDTADAPVPDASDAGDADRTADVAAAGEPRPGASAGSHY